MMSKIVIIFATVVTAVMASLAPVSSGFTIPANQPDGVYEVSFDNTGLATHVFLAPINASASAGVNPEARRGMRPNRRAAGHQPICQGYGMGDHNNAELAYHSLQSTCGNGHVVKGVSGRRSSIYARAGDAVTFFCNDRPNAGDNTCYKEELDYSIRKELDPTCGKYNAGYDQMTDRQCQYGQDSYQRNPRFCGYDHEAK